ncbi:hypothetical protein EGH22_00215 [Halomicroarcula sp. F28]|uniref:hypothetical protein n=1 Tax=Haloarcula salinisoli TaxID=2487746 RepID=UPI001C734B1F|nr:hypothetical protein [Halomicroarcula salinisoli]MBX0284740.1 hypothetical protein [Halomicroarcula salinisoli]
MFDVVELSKYDKAYRLQCDDCGGDSYLIDNEIDGNYIPTFCPFCGNDEANYQNRF